MTFGQLIRTKRSDKQLTQSTMVGAVLAAAERERLKIDFSTGTLSRMENDELVPSPDDARVRLVAEVLNIGGAEIKSTIVLSRMGERPAEWGMSRSEFFGDAQQFVEKIGAGRCQICLIGPDALPVLDMPEVLDVWAKNISEGVDYRVLWFLDFINAESALKLSRTLEELVTRVEKLQAIKTDAGKVPAGSVTHYALRSELDDRLDDPLVPGRKSDRFHNEQIYTALRTNIRPKFNSFQAIKELPGEFLWELALFFDANSTVALYHEKGEPRMGAPEAGLRLRGMRGTLAAAPADVFFWLARDRAIMLEMLLQKFFEAYDMQPAEPAGRNGRASVDRRRSVAGRR